MCVCKGRRASKGEFRTAIGYEGWERLLRTKERCRRSKEVRNNGRECGTESGPADERKGYEMERKRSKRYGQSARTANQWRIEPMVQSTGCTWMFCAKAHHRSDVEEEARLGRMTTSGGTGAVVIWTLFVGCGIIYLIFRVVV
jgi:hypothetical protein